MYNLHICAHSLSSLPVRGAWIEIQIKRSILPGIKTVAPRAGSVD